MSLIVSLKELSENVWNEGHTYRDECAALNASCTKILGIFEEHYQCRDLAYADDLKQEMPPGKDPLFYALCKHSERVENMKSIVSDLSSGNCRLYKTFQMLTNTLLKLRILVNPDEGRNITAFLGELAKCNSETQALVGKRIEQLNQITSDYSVLPSS